MLVYIVEDSLDITEVERYALESMEFEVESFERGAEFFDRVKVRKPDIILLDIIVGEESGFDILDKLRESSETKNIPVILVSSCDSEVDKTRGLDSGADDYISKPFGIMEFTSRIKAIIRRANIVEKKEELSIEGLSIDGQKREVTADGKVCNLTYKEYELLRYLALNKGIVLSRDKIMENVWGFDFQGESRTVDMHVKTLRQKLGCQGKLIQTIRNVGYKMM
ncbi:MAG: response regulator transcription factor [Lachnospiraceae bacterium]|nr:response regulator transcription factor [Lachnospiraceae bacterium]